MQVHDSRVRDSSGNTTTRGLLLYDKLRHPDTSRSHGMSWKGKGIEQPHPKGRVSKTVQRRTTTTKPHKSRYVSMTHPAYLQRSRVQRLGEDARLTWPAMPILPASRVPIAILKPMPSSLLYIRKCEGKIKTAPRSKENKHGPEDDHADGKT